MANGDRLRICNSGPRTRRGPGDGRLHLTSGLHRAKGARGAGNSAGGMAVAIRPRGGAAAKSRNPMRGLTREGFETRGRTQRAPSAASLSPRTHSVGAAGQPTVRDKVLPHPRNAPELTPSACLPYTSPRSPRKDGGARLNAPDSKSGIPQGIGGSNPSLSAISPFFHSAREISRVETRA